MWLWGGLFWLLLWGFFFFGWLWAYFDGLGGGCGLNLVVMSKVAGGGWGV